MILGVDTSEGSVFEGPHKGNAHIIWPPPVMTHAKFARSSDDSLVPDTTSEPAYLFREDSFDPVSRIRRGRFYIRGNTSENWNVVVPDHVSISYTRPAYGKFEKYLTGYAPYRITQETNKNNQSNLLVILGAGSAATIWSLVNIETILTGEELVTLRSRQSMGTLPEMDWAEVPTSGVDHIREAMNTLESDYRRAGPESVVDRANEMATRVLNEYLQFKKMKTQDSLHKIIGELNQLQKEDKKEVAKNAADIVRLMHGRTKYAVQKIHKARPIREQDAELAVQCIGVMLCDLGWGRWT